MKHYMRVLFTYWTGDWETTILCACGATITRAASGDSASPSKSEDLAVIEYWNHQGRWSPEEEF